MTVGYCETINVACITCYWILCNRVGNLLTFLVYRQICKACLPIISSCDFFYSYFLTIRKETNCDFFRTKTLFIVCIIPDLLNRYFRYFWCAAISDHYISLVTVIDRTSIAFDCPNFFHLVLNLFAFRFQRQIAKGMSPVIFSRKFHFFSLCFAVCIKLYLNGVWTFSILVIVVFPTFCNSDAGFTWLVAIGNSCSINRSRVIGYCVFCDCVDNLFAVIVFWKIG